MNKINQQVSKAKSRITAGSFFRILTWALFAGLIVAAIGLTIPKIWAIDALSSDQAVWNWNLGWILGAALSAFLVASVVTYLTRTTSLGAAIEIDKRFGLKERISSAVSLDDSVATTEAGKALIDDATARAERIDVRDQFGFQPTWKALLPLFPALIVAALIFMPNAVQEVSADTPLATKERKEQIKVEFREQTKKLKDRLKKLQEKGLKDAKIDFENLGRKLDELENENPNLKKDALVKLNELQKQIENQKKQFGDAEQMRKNFNQLKKIEQGPAKKFNDALNQGNFEQAQQAVRELAEKLKDGELNEVERKQLARNLQQMADQVKDMVRDHEERKEQLKEQIKQAMRDGDLNKAAQLQDQLEQKQAQDQQMQKMEKMANNLQKAADAMKQQQQQQQKQNGQQNQQGQKQNQQGQKQNQQGQKQNQQGQPNNQKGQNQNQQGQPQQGQKQGQPQDQQGQQPNQQGQPGQQQQGDPSQQGEGQMPTQQQMQDAQQALEDIADMMQKMQNDMDAMQGLQDLEQGLQDCKDGMNGVKMPGQGGKGDKPNWQDWAGGEGRGGGKRARDDSNDPGFYKDRVKGKVKKGESIVTGNADGENVSGNSITESRQLIKASMSEKSDPSENQSIGRSQREHAQQYFEKLRGIQ